MHQNCKHCKMNKINHRVSDLTHTKFGNVLPQFDHLNASETSAIEFFHHLEKTKTKKLPILYSLLLCTDKEKFMPRSAVLKRH